MDRGGRELFDEEGVRRYSEIPVVDSSERRRTLFVAGKPAVIGIYSMGSDGLSGPLVTYDEDGREQYRLTLMGGIPHGPYRLPFRDGRVVEGSFTIGIDSRRGLCWQRLEGHPARALARANALGLAVVEVGEQLFVERAPSRSVAPPASPLVWATHYPDGRLRSEVLAEEPRARWRTWYPGGQLREHGEGVFVPDFVGQVTGYRPDGSLWWQRKTRQKVGRNARFSRKSETVLHWSVYQPDGQRRWLVTDAGVARYGNDGAIDLWLPAGQHVRSSTFRILDATGELWMEKSEKDWPPSYRWRSNDGQWHEVRAWTDHGPAVTTTVQRDGETFLETVLGSSHYRRFVRRFDHGRLRLMENEHGNQLLWDDQGNPVNPERLPRPTPGEPILRSSVPAWLERPQPPLPHPFDVLLLDEGGLEPTWSLERTR